LSSVTDPSAGSQVAQAAVAAEAAATNMRANFVPDPAGGMDKTSFDLLKAPILSAEGLLSGLGAKAAGDAAKDFCAKAGAVLGKFPFNPDSTTDATPDEVFQIFAPGQAFSQFVASPVIKGAVTQQGSQFFKAAGYTSTVNQGFLNFLASAQKIQSTLFASGNQPSLDFTLTEVKSPGIPDATVSVDTQQITKADQKLRFQWVSTPSGHFSLSNPGNSRTSTAPSPWSAFHLAFLATHIPPNRLKFDLETNSQSNATILLDVSGPGAELLNRDFMKGFHCVSQVAH
jgi:type VI protein secretion system component VasK